MTANGECMEFLCMVPAKLSVKVLAGKIDEKGEAVEIDRFSIGNLSGINMALDVVKRESAGRFKGLQDRDRVEFECIGFKKSEKFGNSDMAEFVINVERD